MLRLTQPSGVLLSPMSKDGNTNGGGMGLDYRWLSVSAHNLGFTISCTPLQLFEKGGKEAIAGFKRSRLDHATNTRSPAALTLSTRGAEIADLVVVTFLVLEKQRRMDENSSNNKADALTSADIGFGNVAGGNNVYGYGV